MIVAHEPERNISAEDARRLLTESIKHIAELYIKIGDIPCGVAADNPTVEVLASYLKDADSRLYRLAGDPLPF